MARPRQLYACSAYRYHGRCVCYDHDAAGTAQEAIEDVRSVEGVEKAHIVAGEFDIVAQVTADAERDLLRLVTDEIQPIDGVGRTSTFVILE